MNDFFNAALWEKVWKDESDLKIDRMKKISYHPIQKGNRQKAFSNLYVKPIFQYRRSKKNRYFLI